MRSSAVAPLGDARLLSGGRTIGGEPARLPGIDAPTLCCAGYASGAWYTGPDHDVLRGRPRCSGPATAECGGGLERRDAGCDWCWGWMGVMPKARRTWCAMCCCCCCCGSRADVGDARAQCSGEGARELAALMGCWVGTGWARLAGLLPLLLGPLDSWGVGSWEDEAPPNGWAEKYCPSLRRWTWPCCLLARPRPKPRCR